MRGELFIRTLVGAVLGIAGWRLGLVLAGRSAAASELTWVLSVALGGYACGFLLAPHLAVRPWRWMRDHAWRVQRLVPIQTLVAAAIGMAFALVITALITLPLAMLPDPYGKYAPLGAAVFLICLFVPITVLQGPAVLQFFFSSSPLVSGKSGNRSDFLIVDTNAIIDGRIADIMKTGFVQGTLLIPRFVLDELRHIADSHDSMRRNRGRRGLEMLTQLQRGPEVSVQISDIDFEDAFEVDSKLIMLARTLRCPIVSNDLNLNKVASLQGVKVLSINELANAIKPVVLPGEEMALRIVQEGKEAGQGVGFLDDGTMVVVEGGRRYLDSEVSITVTRVLQTAAGRMIFAKLKEPIGERIKR
jgi:uncharacterized protein YacL